MGKGEWLTILGITLALITTGVAGWVNNEARISTLENLTEGVVEARDVLREEVLILTKEVNVLKGLHQKHVETTTHAPQ